jgi:hypothetical protein
MWSQYRVLTKKTFQPKLRVSILLLLMILKKGDTPMEILQNPQSSSIYLCNCDGKGHCLR